MPRFLRGELLGVVEGPAVLLKIRGEERKFPLGVDLSVSWIMEHLDRPVMVRLDGDRVTEVM